MTMTEGLRELILNKASEAEIADVAHDEGMQTLREDGVHQGPRGPDQLPGSPPCHRLIARASAVTARKDDVRTMNSISQQSCVRMVEARCLRRASERRIPARDPRQGQDHPPRGVRETQRPGDPEVVYGVLNDDQRKRFENNQQLDFAYAIPNVARFRVNCFFQRGSVSAAFRRVPHTFPTLESLKVPEILRDFTRKPRGFVLVTGPTGSGNRRRWRRCST